MKKGLLILIITLCIFISPKCFADDKALVDNYIDGVAYYNGNIVTNTWAYDLSAKNYVKLDEEGHEIMRLDDPKKDPTLKHGKMHVKAEIPKNMNNDIIQISLSTSLYTYDIRLDKSNNFETTIDMVVDTYVVHCVDLDRETNIKFPQQLKVYENNTTELSLDYSKYEENEVVEEEKGFDKRIIIYAFFGIIGLFIILLISLFYKAKNI